MMNRFVRLPWLLILCVLMGGRLLSASAAGPRTAAQQQKFDQALVDAVENSDVVQVRRLLSKGADPDVEIEHLGPLLTVAITETLTTEEVSPAEVRADRAKKRRIVIELLRHRADINAANEQGVTPLMFAISGKDVPMTALLLAHGAKVNLRDRLGMTALAQAVMDEDAETTRLLLRHHADPNICDSHGNPPVSWAMQNITLMRMLLANGASPNLRTPRGTTLLIEALEYNPPSAPASVKGEAGGAVLATVATNAYATQKVFGRNRLVMAERGARYRERIALLLAHGADANAADADGWTPLMRAAFWGDAWLLRALLAHGAHREARDKTGHTALDYARAAGFSSRLPRSRR